MKLLCVFVVMTAVTSCSLAFTGAFSLKDPAKKTEAQKNIVHKSSDSAAYI